MKMRIENEDKNEESWWGKRLRNKEWGMRNKNKKKRQVWGKLIQKYGVIK